MQRVAWVESSFADPTRRSFGELQVDESARLVKIWGREVRLTRMELRLLVALVRRPDEVLTRGELLRSVWASSALNQTRTIDVHVQRVREKLGTAARFIQTVRGAGYRFRVATVER